MTHGLKPTRLIIVVDPRTADSTLEDVMFYSSPKELALQLRGGLDIEKDNVAVFVDAVQAKQEAQRRMMVAAICADIRTMPADEENLINIAELLGVPVPDDFPFAGAGGKAGEPPAEATPNEVGDDVTTNTE